MIWQNPWAWVGLATLALPVLVHLFSRRQTRVVPFPSLRFVDVSRLLPTRRTQLSDVPLLLLRLLLLAVAVAALAQPLFSRAGTTTSSTAARVLLIDSLSVARDADGAVTLPSAISTRLAEATRSMRIETVSPRSELAGAAAWLGAQGGAGELLIVSDFRGDVIDSLDIAALPSSISVQLVRVSEGARGARLLAQRSHAVEWATSINAATMESTIEAVKVSGGNVVTRAQAGESAGGAENAAIIVASPDADSLGAWIGAAAPLSTPWMGDEILSLHADTTLVTALHTTTLSDSAVSAPFVVVNTATNDAPAVLAASLPAANGADRLLLISRAPASSLATAALLLAASRVDRVAMSAVARTVSIDAAAANTSSVAPDDAQLQRWASAPRLNSAARTGQQGVGTDRRPVDASTGSSDARWLWFLVVMLLIGETMLRRRIERDTSPSGADDTRSITSPSSGQLSRD